MRVILEFTQRPNDLPLLRMYIHHAPHYRQHYKVIAKLRQELVEGAKMAEIKIPIRVPIDLWVLFIDPVSPDVINLGMALTRAMDGSTTTEPALLEDDSLIAWVSGMGSYRPNRATRSDRPFRSRYFETTGA